MGMLCSYVCGCVCAAYHPPPPQSHHTGIGKLNRLCETDKIYWVENNLITYYIHFADIFRVQLFISRTHLFISSSTVHSIAVKGTHFHPTVNDPKRKSRMSESIAPKIQLNGAFAQFMHFVNHIAGKRVFFGLRTHFHLGGGYTSTTWKPS